MHRQRAEPHPTSEKPTLKLEIGKDAFHLETVWELLSRLKDLQMDEARAAQRDTAAAADVQSLQLIIMPTECG